MLINASTHRFRSKGMERNMIFGKKTSYSQLRWKAPFVAYWERPLHTISQHYLTIIEYIWPFLTILDIFWPYSTSFYLIQPHLTSIDIIGSHSPHSISFHIFQKFSGKLKISQKIDLICHHSTLFFILWHHHTSFDIMRQI